MLKRYSSWQYGILIGIVLWGLLYAAPNLFGDQHILEINRNDNTTMARHTVDRIEQVLVQHNIAVQGIEPDRAKLIIKLKQFDAQLTAQEILKTTLGDAYTVTVNLVPNTPSWLKALGAKPMKLGLDLRGGVHFLLQVDVDSAVHKQVQSDLRAMQDSLQQANKHYVVVRSQPDSHSATLKI